MLQVWSDFHHDFLARWRADIEGAAKRRVDLIKARERGESQRPCRAVERAGGERRCTVALFTLAPPPHLPPSLPLQDAEPPFRMATQRVFDKASGTLADVPVPPTAWDDEVAEGFFARQARRLGRPPPPS